MTIEKGVWNKQVVERQVTAQEALEVMLPINEANQLWTINIYLISLFPAVFITLFYTPLRPKKNFKWYVGLYFIVLTTFIIWDINVHWGLAEEISEVMEGLK